MSVALKLPIPVARLLARFDALSLRERALVAGACLIGMVLLWFATVFDPATARQRSLSAELSTLQQSIQLTTQTIQETADTDPTLVAQREETRLEAQLAEINTQLAAKSAGLIPPERMVQGVFGNGGRNVLIGPGFNQWDFSVLKIFNIQEKARLQFRAESFNIFNHPSFTGIDTTARFDSAGKPAQTYGAVTGAGPARVLEFGVKLLW